VRFKGLAFPITRDVGDSGDHGDPHPLPPWLNGKNILD
jgi:hypothetical protein